MTVSRRTRRDDERITFHVGAGRPATPTVETTPEPEVRPDAADPKTPLHRGDQVTAYLDNGISITLSRSRETSDEPYRVVILRAGVVLDGGARTFPDENAARAQARAVTVAYHTGGMVSTEIRRADGRVYNIHRYTNRSDETRTA